MTLINQLTSTNDRLRRLGHQLGIPLYVPVALITPDDEHILLDPVPLVETLDTADIRRMMTNDVRPNDDMRWIKGISRSIDITLLEQCQYLLDAKETDGVWTGTLCEYIYIDRNRTLDYNTLVQIYRRR
jgi:hypothetical protein